MLSRLLSCAFLGYRTLFATTPITRRVVNGPLDDILLYQWDLAPADTDYLKVLEQKRFTEKYGEAGKLYKIKDLKEDRVRRYIGSKYLGDFVFSTSEYAIHQIVEISVVHVLEEIHPVQDIQRLRSKVK